VATKAKKANFLDDAATEPAAAKAAAAPDVPTRASKRKPETRSDRIGKRGKIFYMNEAAEKQLSILAIEEDTTQQDLLISAVNALFIRYGKKPIA
jgi:hypothetical protein